MLDLYKLHIFTLVAREGSFSAAAQRLLMTQSGVSQHIQDLEHALGTALFVRGRRGVALTPAGEAFIGRIFPAPADAIVPATSGPSEREKRTAIRLIRKLGLAAAEAEPARRRVHVEQPQLRHLG